MDPDTVSLVGFFSQLISLGISCKYLFGFGVNIPVRMLQIGLKNCNSRVWCQVGGLIIASSKCPAGRGTKCLGLRALSNNVVLP